jgi:ribosomal protein S14
MLAEYPDKSFAVSRAVIVNAIVKTQTLNVSRVGGRTLVFRIRYPADGRPLFEWAEVDRAQLRTLVTALMMTEEQFRLSTAAGEPAAEAVADLPPDSTASPLVNFCPYCGSPSGEGFRFCRACGRELPTS